MIDLNDWLSINKTSGEGNDTITLTADKCETDNERNTSLTIKTETKEVIVNVSQIMLTEAYTSSYKPLLSSEWQGATKTIKVITTHEDLTYTAPEWVTITSERNGYINTYTVTFEPNTTNSRRFGSLKLKTSNWTFNPILLAQGIESEENKVIFYRGYTGSVEPYNSNGIIQHRKDEYVGMYGSVSSLLYDSPIIDVPENLFNNTVIESVSLPPSVKTIGKSAFYKAGLLGVDWYDGITTIGEKAFEDAFNAIPPSFVVNFPVLELPSSLKTIGKRAFALNSMFQTINFPTGLTTIGDSAFYNCSNLTSVTIGNGVTSIGNGAFLYCTSLTSVVILDSVTSIGDETFRECGKLTSVDLGNGVTSIGKEAFGSCETLTSITIPDSVTSIGENAFLYCYNLASVNLGNGVTTIGEAAFNDCDSLTEITIPNSVTTIDKYAFIGCSKLASVDLGNGLTTIGERAFNACSNLTSITCKAIVAPTIDSQTFYIIGTNGVLKYPSGSNYSSWLRTNEYYLGYYGWTGSPY